MSTTLAESPLSAAAERLVAQFHERRPLRTGSLLITVFGDVIFPRGGAVWLSDLLVVMERFGLSQRLVRTALTRLAQDGWFDIQQVGRRSVYRISELGTVRIRDASTQIYSDPRTARSGAWTLVLLSEIPTGARDEVRRQLELAGMRAATPNTFLAPATDALDASLGTLSSVHPLLILRHGQVDRSSASALRGLVERVWRTQQISEDYESFISQFRELLTTPAPTTDAVAALKTRILLVHHYRRLVLRDPRLPADLLPTDWAGLRAYQLTRSAYKAMLPASELAVEQLMTTPWGTLPPRQNDASEFR